IARESGQSSTDERCRDAGGALWICCGVLDRPRSRAMTAGLLSTKRSRANGEVDVVPQFAVLCRWRGKCTRRTRDLAHRLDPTRARGSRLERGGEILRLPRDLTVREFHDAHGVKWSCVVGHDELGDPQAAGADNAANLKALFVRLGCARSLDVVPAPDALSRLGIFKPRIDTVDVVLRREVACVRGL